MQIPSDFLRESRRLFGRLGHVRGEPHILSHNLVAADFHGITLAATDGVHWLETFRRSMPEPGGPFLFLMSPEALADACRADRGTPVDLIPQGPFSRPRLEVLTRRAGLVVSSIHPSPRVKAFPSPAAVAGDTFLVPARTLESLAVVASPATGQRPFPAVAFTPRSGGRLIATCSRRISCVPAVVPPRGFMLPDSAVRVLSHPDFRGYENEVTLPDGAEISHVMFRAWDHLLIARCQPGDGTDRDPLEPEGFETRWIFDGAGREAVVSWLRGLREPRTPVRLEPGTGGHLHLIQRTGSGAVAELRVALRSHGRPTPLAMPPRDLAAGLEIGPVLCLRGDDGPLLCRDVDGAFCLLMPPDDAAARGRPAA